ncbi:MAG: Gfo/Idh/MocA family oxidoreductase [Patescibacteria group bacterium]
MEEKFLICGLGSIGKRHLENLERLGAPCENILIFRTSKGAKNFGDKVLEEHKNRHPVFSDIDEALKIKPIAAIISNPTSLHIPFALKAAKAGSHVFIEKPLSDSLDGIDELIKEIDNKRLSAYVAYNFRFHPLLIQTKKWIESGAIGKIISVRAEMSGRITDWHPWEDFKISYAGRKDLGGGAILSLSHVIDYLYWLFGKPHRILTAAGNFGGLGIDVEDVAECVFQFSNPDKIISFHLDFLKRPGAHFLEILGAKGIIYLDFSKNTADLTPLDAEAEKIELKNFERNETYLQEMRHFLECVKTGKQTLIDLKQSKVVLEIILAVKKSARGKKT